jgi:hypothetical protein
MTVVTALHKMLGTETDSEVAQLACIAYGEVREA